MSFRKTIFLIVVAGVVSCSHPEPATFVETKQKYKRTEREAEGREYAIATQGKATSEAAQKILNMGGNVFDAAVAASFTISVERPQSTGIGGGGFMVLYHAKEKKAYALDFREVAPLKAYEAMYQDKDGNVIPKKSLTGIFAVAVPGLVAGLEEVHKKFGSLPWEKLLEPAIELAENGFKVYPHLEWGIEYHSEFMSKSDYAKSIFFNEDGSYKKVGDTLIQKDLAKTLREIQKKGAKGFYEGWVRDAILAESKRRGGLLTEEDFSQKIVKYREPVEGWFQNFHVISMPPPSSGGVHALQILKTIDPTDIAKFGPESPVSIHYLSSAMQAAYADRFKYMGDPDFVDIPIKKILSHKHTKDIRKKFWLKRKAIASKEYSEFQDTPQESNETSHFSMIDRDGNIVSSTQTINWLLGSGVVAEGTGVVLNNEMDDFTAKVGVANQYGLIGGKKNIIEPLKKPLSSMTPTIVLDWKRRPVLALGTPDGSRIISCVVQVILNYIEFKMPLYEAVSTRRYHHQWYPEEIWVESPGFSKEVQSELETMGHKVKTQDYNCKVQAIAREGKVLKAVSDIRGEGLSLAK